MFANLPLLLVNMTSWPLTVDKSLIESPLIVDRSLIELDTFEGDVLVAFNNEKLREYRVYIRKKKKNSVGNMWVVRW